MTVVICVGYVQAFDLISALHHVRFSQYAKFGALSDVYLQFLQINAKTLPEFLEQVTKNSGAMNKDSKENEELVLPQRADLILRSCWVAAAATEAAALDQSNPDSKQRVPARSPENNPVETTVDCDAYISPLLLMTSFKSDEKASLAQLWLHATSLRGPSSTSHHLSFSAWITSATFFIEPPNRLPRGSDPGSLYNPPICRKPYGVANLIVSSLQETNIAFDNFCLVLLVRNALIRKSSSQLLALARVPSPSSSNEHLAKWATLTLLADCFARILQTTDSAEASKDSIIQEILSEWSQVVDSLEISLEESHYAPKSLRKFFCQCFHTTAIVALLVVFSALISPTSKADASQLVSKQVARKWFLTLSSGLDRIRQSLSRLSEWIRMRSAILQSRIGQQLKESLEQQRAQMISSAQRFNSSDLGGCFDDLASAMGVRHFVILLLLSSCLSNFFFLRYPKKRKSQSKKVGSLLSNSLVTPQRR